MSMGIRAQSEVFGSMPSLKFARAWLATLREQGFFAPTAVREILSPKSHRSIHGA